MYIRQKAHFSLPVHYDGPVHYAETRMDRWLSQDFATMGLFQSLTQ